MTQGLPEDELAFSSWALCSAAALTELVEPKLGLVGKTLEDARAINLEYAKKMDPVLKGRGPKKELREELEGRFEKEDAG